jgi:putative flippase GtrA
MHKPRFFNNAARDRKGEDRLRASNQRLGSVRMLLRFPIFAGVGILAAVAYAIVMYVCVKRFELPIFWGSVFAFASGIPISYYGNRRLTYQSENDVPSEISRFFVAQFVNLLATSTVVAVATECLSLPLYGSVALSYVTAPCITFLLFEIWVYKEHH